MITEVVKDLPPSFLEQSRRDLIENYGSEIILNVSFHVILICLVTVMLTLPFPLIYIASLEVHSSTEYKKAKERTDRFLDNVAICKTALRQLQLEKQQVITPGILGVPVTKVEGDEK